MLQRCKWFLSFAANTMGINYVTKPSLQHDTCSCDDMHFLLSDRLKEIERLMNSYRREKDLALKRKYLIQIQRRLVKSQEYGDEKLQLVGHMMDMVSSLIIRTI